MTLQEAFQSLKDHQHIIGESISEELIIQDIVVAPKGDNEVFKEIIKAVLMDNSYLHLLNENDDFEVYVISSRGPDDIFVIHNTLESTLNTLG